MQRLRDLKGLELTSRYGALIEMEKSKFKDEKTNADILIGASNFKKLFQKVKPMSLIDDSMNSFWFNECLKATENHEIGVTRIDDRLCDGE